LSHLGVDTVHLVLILLGTLDAAMTQQTTAALQATRGRIEGPAGAALMLGINPHRLRGRMRKLGIDWRRYRRPFD
jgi:transcriptional regulator with GAF, ATPase, and Fis domain